MNGGLSKLWQKDGTKSVLASLILSLIHILEDLKRLVAAYQTGLVKERPEG